MAERRGPLTPGQVDREENRRALTLIACPTCHDSVFLVSVDAMFNVHIECATCPPAPAVRLTRDHLRAALTGAPLT